MNSRGAAFWTALILAGVVLALGVYWPHLHNEFILDDQAQVVENPHLRSDASWAALFKVDLWGHMKGKIGTHNTYYRPLLYVAYRLIFSVAGENPFPFHLASVLLHIVCALLAAELMRRLGVQLWVAAAAATLFMFSPLAGETLYSIAAMNDQLMLLFLLLAIYLTVRSRGSHGYSRILLLLAATMCTAGAVLAKETGVVVPMLLAIEAMTGQRSSWNARLRDTLPAWGVLALYLLVRQSIFGGTVPGGLTSDIVSAVGSAALAIGWYIRHLLLPYPLTPIHRFPPTSVEGLEAVVVAIVFLAAVGGAWCVLRRRDLRFWVAWIVLPLVPTLFHFFSGRQVISGVVVAERYTYVSLVPWSLLLTLGILRILSRFLTERMLQAVLGSCVVALCSLFAVELRIYGEAFRNNDTLFTYANKMNPDNAFVMNGLAQKLLSEGRPSEALVYLDQAIASEPRAAVWRVTRGIALNDLGRHQEAVGELNRALALEPDIAQARISLAEAYRDTGDLFAAGREYEKASLLDPDNIGVLINLGAARFLTGDLDGAVVSWEQARALDPGHPEPLFNLGLALRTMERNEEAVPYLEQFLGVAGADRESQRKLVQTWLSGGAHY